MLKIKSKRQGAELTSILKDGNEMLFDGKTFWNRQSPILFPIVGQIKEGKTQIEGKIYEMSQHGFARDLEYEPVTKLDNFHSYVLKSNRITQARYPFDFELYNTYRMDANKLTTIYKVINTGKTNMPFCIGGHPAFKCDYSTGDYEIVFEQNEENIEFLKLRNGLIDTENATNILEENKIHLTENIFDNDAIIMKNIKSNKVILQNRNTNKKILEFDFTDFPYLALWSKKGAPFVCIEPWQNTADKIDSNQIYKEKENILSIEPDEIYSCKYIVKFY